MTQVANTQIFLSDSINLIKCVKESLLNIRVSVITAGQHQVLEWCDRKLCHLLNDKPWPGPFPNRLFLRNKSSSSLVPIKPEVTLLGIECIYQCGFAVTFVISHSCIQSYSCTISHAHGRQYLYLLCR